MQIGVTDQGPREITADALRPLQDFCRQAAEHRGATVVATDLFRFQEYCAVQLLARQGGFVDLQLLLFRKPGHTLFLSFEAPEAQYHSLARSIEASIASIDWNP